MRRPVVVTAVVAFSLAACFAPLAFLRWHGGMRMFSPGWLAIGLVVLAAYSALAWILSPPGHPEKPRRGDRVRRVLAAPPMRIAAGLCYGLVFMAFMIAFTSAFTGRSGSTLIAAGRQAPMGLMLAGISILGGVFLRRQAPPQCAKCHYDLTGPPDGGYDMCPECGADVRGPATIVRERRELHRGVLAVGVVLAAAPFVWFFFAFRAPLAAQGWYLPYVPTASLIVEVVGAPRGFTMAEWTELATRTLTPAQEGRLFEGLLTLRADRGHLDKGAEAFLDRVAESGATPSESRERYYSEMFVSRLAARPGGPDGRTFVVSVETDYRGPLFSMPVQVGVVVTGFEVASLPVTDTLRFGGLGVGVPLQGATAEAGPGPSVEVRPEDWGGRGEITVRARGWCFAVPPGTPNPRGERPVFPPGTLWTGPLDLTITLKR